jgi:hypothetical protein
MLHAGRLAKKIRSPVSDAIIVIVVGLALSSCLATVGRAQSVPRFPVVQRATTPADSANDHYWQRFAVGFASSILAHESAHILSSLLMGFHPYVALDHARPTVFSGIDSYQYPHKQFIFSASGLTTQALINELILDIPHDGGGPIERGILAGGVGTTLFYITIGRNGSVSDISVMARTSSLSKTQLSLIFGGFSAIQTLRISRNPMYSHFFARPTDDGLALGLSY